MDTKVSRIHESHKFIYDEYKDKYKCDCGVWYNKYITSDTWSFDGPYLSNKCPVFNKLNIH